MKREEPPLARRIATTIFQREAHKLLQQIKGLHTSIEQGDNILKLYKDPRGVVTRRSIKSHLDKQKYFEDRQILSQAQNSRYFMKSQFHLDRIIRRERKLKQEQKQKRV